MGCTQSPGEFTPVPEQGIRTRDWLYVRQPERRKLLFDEASDPHELDNLVADSAFSRLMDEFDVRIAAHMEATGDDWNLRCEFPPPGFLSHEETAERLRKDLLPRAIAVP